MAAHVSIIKDPQDDRERHLTVAGQEELLAQNALAPLRAPGGKARAQLAPWQVSIAKDMMLAEPQRQPLIAAVADRLGLSPNHFIKAFGNTVGTAPYHWFLQQRIAQSLALLRDDTVPLARIADTCGFADQSHFTKTFKRVLGVAPGKWRKKNRAGTAPAVVSGPDGPTGEAERSPL